MNVRTGSKIVLAFLFSFFSLLFLPMFFPFLRLTYFAPFLIIIYYKSSLKKCLWLSMVCGVLIDLLSSHVRLGIHALNYCLTTSFLYQQKRHFFEDRLSTLPIMTFFFSFLSTICQVIFLAIFDNYVNISLQWVWTDLVVMPIIDAVYAFVLFSLTGFFMPKAPQHEYFLK